MWSFSIFICALFVGKLIFPSGRLLATEQQRVLDDASRRRRLRKQLDALEQVPPIPCPLTTVSVNVFGSIPPVQDNYQEDPHAQLQWHKKIPKFDLDEAMPTSSAGLGSGRKRPAPAHDGEQPPGGGM